jgi:hypothetical protein
MRGLREIARFGHLPLIQTLCGEVKIDDETIDRVMLMEAAKPGEVSEIAGLQRQREELHAEIITLEKPLIARVRRYATLTAGIAEHREASNFVHLVDHVRVHRIVTAVWSRLVDYAGLFERDLYFVTLALLHREGMAPDDLLNSEGVCKLRDGQTITALGFSRRTAGNRRTDDAALTLLQAIERHFGYGSDGKNALTGIRNILAHLDLRDRKRTAAPAPQLTARINDTRRLMAYDRKMKNAVSKSVIDLMEREGVVLSWSIPEGSAGHGLTDARLAPRTIQHLGKKCFCLLGGDPKKREPLKERLVSEACVRMLAEAFGGRATHTESLREIIARIDWTADPNQRRHSQGQTGRARAGARNG